MKKHPSPEPKFPKGVLDYIKQHKKFEKQGVGFTKGCKKQAMQIARIAKEAAVANRKIKEQDNEIKRLKRNLRNLFS